MSGGDDERAREIMARAIRRLNILEYLILGAAAVLALAGGAVAAWLLGSIVNTPFRVTWVVSSLLLFVVPGGMVYLRERLITHSEDSRGRDAGANS